MKNSILHRFSTIGTPQLISTDEKTKGFVFHPNLANSNFLNVISGVSGIPATQTALKSEAGNFNAYDKYQEVVDVNPELYKFALWLSKNKNRLNGDELVAATNSVVNLTQPQLTEIWENLL